MSIEELAKLSDEELRVMCAELCGFVKVPHAHYFDRIAFIKDGAKFASFDLPNCPVDLNAMNKAEKTLPVGKWTTYENCLMQISKTALIAAGTPAVDAARICTIGATARQRCIAFIATRQPDTSTTQPLECTGRDSGKSEGPSNAP